MDHKFTPLPAKDILLGIDRSPSMWMERSKQLWQAAQILQDAAQEAYEELFPLAIRRQDEQAKLVADGVSEDEARTQTSGSLPKEQDLQLTSATTMQGAMLRAFSIECLLKAIFYEREINANEHVKDCDEVDHTHNLCFLAGKLGMKLSEQHAARCQSLQELMILGRYPTLKREEKDKASKKGVLKTWHANPESNPPADLDLRN